MKTENDIILELKELEKELSFRIKRIKKAIKVIEYAKDIVDALKSPDHIFTKVEAKQTGNTLCVECKAEFEPRQTNSKYCSERCAKKVSNRNYRMVKKEKLSGTEPEPLPLTESDQVRIREQQNKKLMELREKYPVKRGRPVLNRDFQTV